MGGCAGVSPLRGRIGWAWQVRRKKVMGLFSQVTFGKAVDRIFVDSSGRRLAASFVAAFSRSTELDECVCKFLRDDDEDHHGGWKKLNFQHLLQRFTKWPDSKIVSLCS